MGKSRIRFGRSVRADHLVRLRARCAVGPIQADRRTGLLTAAIEGDTVPDAEEVIGVIERDGGVGFVPYAPFAGPGDRP